MLFNMISTFKSLRARKNKHFSSETQGKFAEFLKLLYPSFLNSFVDEKKYN